VSRSSGSVARFGLFEISLRPGAHYRNPFIDVTLDGRFSGPGGATVAVPGFYYGAGEWRIRFRPPLAGRWTYTWEFAGGGARQTGGDAFDCTLPEDGNGRVRRNASNPYRWSFDTGEAYFPVGFQEGASARENGTYLIDGESRDGPRRTVPVEEYFRIYGEAGFNMLRFSQRNASYSLFDDLDHYRERESIATDRFLETARHHGFRVMFGFFGFYGRWSEAESRWGRALERLRRLEYFSPEEAINRPRDLRTIEREKRFVRYSVARWGAWADFWELLNERYASDDWTGMMAAYVDAIDPDRKPVSTSWEKPALPAIDVNAPHWYESESELESDLRVRRQAERWKAFGKPVLVGEQGNTGMNWDPGSALRMRIRLWTALFQEIGLIFWNTSWSKAGMNQGRYTPGNASNIYLGPEERGYVRVLADFSARLDAGVRMTNVSVSDNGVRAYGLLSPKVAAAYLHHFAGHKTPAAGVRVTLALPQGRPLVAQWIDPASGDVMARVPLRSGAISLAAPPFRVDVALLVTVGQVGSPGRIGNPPNAPVSGAPPGSRGPGA
jgi:hypothetical protein